MSEVAAPADRDIVSTMPRAMVCGRQADPLEDGGALGVVEELLRDAVQPDRGGHPGLVERLEQHGTAAADHAVVLDRHHEAVGAGEVDEGRVDGLDPAGVDDGDADALVDQSPADLRGGGGHRADADDEHVLGAAAQQHVAPAHATDGLEVRGRRPLGEAHDGGGVVDGDRLVEQLAEPGGVARGGQAQAGDDLQDRQVPHAVVAGTVVTGDAGAVEDEGHAALVQGDVHQHLVEGPVEERGVHRDDRVQAAHREPRRRGRRVLLGDAHVEGPARVALRELVEPHHVHHRRGDRDHVRAALAELDHLVGEHVGPDEAARDLLAGLDVEGLRGVELVGDMALGGGVAEALVGDGVHDDRPLEPLGLGQRLLHRGPVVAVDGADVLESEVLEEALRGQGVLHALLHRVQDVVRRGSDAADGVEALLDHVEQLLVARVGAQAW